MSTHSEPRRFWIRQHSGSAPSLLDQEHRLTGIRSGVESKVVAEIAVREDKATSADREAATEAIHAAMGSTDDSECCALCAELADAVLARIFKEGGEQS
jgi:hypothetical protein